MTKPYSLDLRERVAARVLAGGSVRSVAETFSVSVATVVRWSQRQRTAGTPACRKMGGHRQPLLAGERAFLLERLSQEPHVSLRKLMAELAEIQRISLMNIGELSVGQLQTDYVAQAGRHERLMASR